jgi:hypothetical protein
MVVPLGLGVGDLIQVSNLAFKLYRRCRDSSDEFKTLSHEGRLQALKESSFTKDHSLSGKPSTSGRRCESHNIVGGLPDDLIENITNDYQRT